MYKMLPAKAGGVGPGRTQGSCLETKPRAERGEISLQQQNARATREKFAFRVSVSGRLSYAEVVFKNVRDFYPY